MADKDFQNAIAARYDAPMYRAMLEVWSDQIHPGLFENDDDTLYDASVRATRRLAELAAIDAGSNVLETACGVGGTARFLAGDLGCTVTATNISRGQLETASDLTEGKPGADRIGYEFANFEELPFSDESFDAYWCQDALLYSIARDSALAEAARVVKPGGAAAISDLTIVGTPQGEAAELMERITKAGFWSLDQYAAAFETAGFEVTATEDWSHHLLRSFRLILHDMIDKRDTLAAIAGDEETDTTIARYHQWCAGCETGHLGWGAVVGRKKKG
tara:strand:- start:3632 stop:4456 length:825 start_codon:yes stop_codon:yes gene_type:complete